MVPLFSIVVPVYKVEHYLRDCLDSILGQAGVAFEIIAVNDCSPDGSLEILREYERIYRNFKVVNFQSNKGVGAARNAGLEVSSGKWVLFMDSDDTLVPGALPTIEEAMRKEDCDIIIFGHVRVDDIHAEVEARCVAKATLVDMQDANSAIGFVKEVFPHRLWAWNKCIRRSVIGDLRFGDFQPCEDAVFILECLFRSRTVLVLSDVLYKYIQHEGSCLSMVTAKRINGDIIGMRGLCDVVLAWRYGDYATKITRQQLLRCFLARIPNMILRLRSEDNHLKCELTEEFFKAADHVFVNSGLCNWPERAVLRVVLSHHSLDILNSYLKWQSRANRILSLPRRACRKVAKMLSVHTNARNGS